MKKLFVGNLSFNTDENSLRSFFANYEPIRSVKIVTDRETGRPRGFAFVELDEDSAAERAIEELNGQNLDGRQIAVNEARPQGERGGGGGGGGGGGRFGGGGGGGRGGRQDGWSNNSRSRY